MHVYVRRVILVPHPLWLVDTNATVAIPGLFLALITHPSFTRQKISSLRRVLFGGTIISPATLTAAADSENVNMKGVMAGFGMRYVNFGVTPSYLAANWVT